MKNGNNPAFPYASQDAFVRGGMAEAGISLAGLTKREMFAMAAMQGILANEASIERGISAVLKGTAKGLASHVAGMSVEYADELLKQLES